MSGINRHMPGCGCCGCEVFTDDFNRADDTNIGSDWSEESGAWAIASNKLAGSSNGIAVYNTTISQASYKVESIVRTDTANDTVGVVAYYTDANNYYSAILSIGAGTRTLKIFETVAGVTTERASVNVTSAAVNVDHTVSLCVNHDGSSAHLAAMYGSTPLVAWSDATPLSGPGKAGVYRKSAAGATTWDEFSVSLTNTDDCPGCVCGLCTEGTSPNSIQVVIAGATGYCSDINGTYVLDKVVDCYAATDCEWQLTGLSKGQACNFQWLRARYASDGTFYVNFHTGSKCNLSLSIQWSVGLGSNDCSSWSSVSISTFLASSCCGSMGSPTCTLTAL